MKKIKLNAKADYNFHLLGIISKSKDYTVSWAINKVLDIELAKQEDLPVELVSGESAELSLYYYETDFFRITLIDNQVISELPLTQKLFVPSLGTFDYLLKIEDLEDTSDLNETFAKIRTSDKIDSIVKLDILKVKEKESLIF